MSTVFLNPSFDAFANLQLMANSSAYTTLGEEEASKKTILDHYGMKKGFAITTIISLIALAIILGTVVHSHASTVVMGIIVPFGILISFRSKHKNLEKLQKIEYENCIEIIIRVTEYLKKLRNDKINYLLNTKSGNYHSIKETETEYNKEHNYLSVVELAAKAQQLIKRHYTINYSHDSSNNYLLNFIKACSDLCGTHENPYKLVVTLDEGRFGQPSKILAKPSSHHPYVSVIAERDTKFYT